MLLYNYKVIVSDTSDLKICSIVDASKLEFTCHCSYLVSGTEDTKDVQEVIC